jgi:hypothetical protein
LAQVAHLQLQGQIPLLLALSLVAVVLVVAVTELLAHILVATVVQVVERQVLKVVDCRLLWLVVQAFLGKVTLVAQTIPIATLTVVVEVALALLVTPVQVVLVVMALQIHYALILP